MPGQITAWPDTTSDQCKSVIINYVHEWNVTLNLHCKQWLNDSVMVNHICKTVHGISMLHRTCPRLVSYPDPLK